MALTTAQRRALAASFNLGIDVDKYIDQAIRSGVRDIVAFAYALILRSPEFKARFPGIFRSNGTLRISPAEYVSREDSYISSAAAYGISLNRSHIAGLIRTNKTPEKVATIFKGIQLFRQNPELIPRLQANIAVMNQIRRKAGLPLIPNVKSTADVINFFSNQSEMNVYRAYEGSIIQSEFEHVGFKLTSQQAQKLADRTEGVDPREIQERALDLFQKLNLAGPELRAELTQQELLTLEFGGRNQTEVIAKADRILKQREAALESKPEPRTEIQPYRPEPGF